MKIYTATERTQGQRAGDYHWCVEGEIVVPLLVVCDRDRDDPDGGCGCGRGWSGLNSHKATTTAMVRDLDMTEADYTEAVRSSLGQMGWYPRIIDDATLQDLLDDATELANTFPVGAILETRLGEVRWRD